MTCNEFISLAKSNGAILAAAADDRNILLASTGLQQIRAAALPNFMIELYKATGGIILDNAYVFGPNEMAVTQKFPVPTIVQINTEISGNPEMVGKTVFGRNDLFWFAFDAFGTCFMLDNLTLKQLRKYDDPWRAILDCLAAGKI